MNHPHAYRNGAVAGVIADTMMSMAMMTSACEDGARQPVVAGTGPHPELSSPSTTLIPTVNIASAEEWPRGATPTPAPGMSVDAFATGLDHPRWLYVLPSGGVLVAETNAPPKPEDNKGIKGRYFKHFQKKAGAAVPSANRISTLREVDGDGAFYGWPYSYYGHHVDDRADSATA